MKSRTRPALTSSVGGFAVVLAFVAGSSFGQELVAEAAIPETSAAGTSMVEDITAAASFVTSPAPGLSNVTADRILVRKSERKLFLMAGDEVVKDFDISLGGVPKGPKRREGDSRTPEGRYFIESKNSTSDFFLALKISYPSAADRARARRLGVNPGGQIMIHGLPNVPRYSEASYLDADWTDGCIAVSNSDMIDLWRLTQVSMPIEIVP